MDSEHLFYLGIGALVVILLAVLFTKKVKATLNSKEGLTIDSAKNDKVNVTKVKTSSVGIKKKQNEDINVSNIEDSNIDIGG